MYRRLMWLLAVVMLLVGSVPVAANAAPFAQDPGWFAEYYANHDLAGAPVLTRYEPSIDYVWGTSSPSAMVPIDQFSVRWTRHMNFSAGTYNFCATVDDGVRFWVDGQLLIDQWRVTGVASTYCASPYLTAGTHVLQMAYFEDTGNALAKLVWTGPIPVVPSPGPPVPWPPSPAEAWLGEYYDDMMLGSSVSPAKAPVMVRMDPQINFNWGTSSPAVGLPAFEYSVRWTRDVNLPAANYNFCATVDDGVRVWVDGVLILDEWREQSVRTFCATQYLAAGRHTLQVAYKQHRGDAIISFSYSSGSVPPPVPTPVPPPWPPAPTPVPPWPPAPTPVPPWPPYPTQPPPVSGWNGEYFANTYFGGPPVLTRVDPEINFDWGWNPPAPGMPADDFSVRWTRDVWFDNNVYTFCARHDDGVRILVDGAIVVDAWFEQAAAVHCGVRPLTAGTHRVQVDYYERSQVALISVWWTVGGQPPTPPQPTPVPPWPSYPTPQPPWPPAPSPAQEVVVDNTDPGFTWGGPISSRQVAYLGVGGTLFWTYNSSTNPINYGRWTPRLFAPGYYEVFAFIPREYATSTRVRYRVIHAYGQRRDRIVNQCLYNDQWVSLGTYYFTATGNEFVVVYDNTREPYGSAMIAFDAVRFVPR